jgi:uncharacterized protein YndB with AHSA1/START domain
MKGARRDRRAGGKPIEHIGRDIRAEIRTKATPQEAYDAWADPKKIAPWFPDRAEGKAESGRTITWILDKFNYRIPYEVLIARPGEKFAIRWNPPPGMNPGVLEVIISKEGERPSCVRGCGWGLCAGNAKEIEAHMERAIGRLAATLAASKTMAGKGVRPKGSESTGR